MPTLPGLFVCLLLSAAFADEAPKSQVRAGSISWDHLRSNVGLLEGLACVLVVLFIYVYIQGKRFNDSLAQAWFKAVNPILELQFAKVGAYHNRGSANTSALVKESPSSFLVYASGRRNCSGLLASIQLKNRQDLVSLAMAWLRLAFNTDQCVLEIPLDTETMEPFVFVVCKKRDEKKLRKEHRDVEQFLTKSITFPVLNSKGFAVLSETPEVMSTLLDGKIVKVISDSQDLFTSLHITDATSLPNSLSLATLRLEFKVPSVHQMHRIKKIVEMALFLADQIATIKLTNQARSRATSIRSKIAQAHRKQAHEERQEEIQRKKLETLEQQRNALSGEALRQFEERQQKLSMKRRGPRMKVMR